jgi:hypothetical protein
MGKRFDAALLHAPDLEIEGLAMAPWRDDVRRYFERVLRMDRPRCQRGLYPYIALG